MSGFGFLRVLKIRGSGAGGSWFRSGSGAERFDIGGLWGFMVSFVRD